MSCVSLFPHLPSILISLVWVLLCFFHGTAVVSTQSLRGFSTYTNMLVCSPPNTQQTQPDVVDDGHRSNADWLKGGAGQARHSSMHHKCVRYKNTLKMKKYSMRSTDVGCGSGGVFPDVRTLLLSAAGWWTDNSTSESSLQTDCLWHCPLVTVNSYNM